MSIGELLSFDKRDRKLVQALELDSRQSFRELGQKSGLSAESVKYRLQKWKSEGFIIRLFAEPNIQRLGLKTYRIYLRVENMTPEIEKAFETEYSTKRTVQWFAILQGEWSYIIRFTLKDENDFRKEVMHLLAEYGKYVKAKDIGISVYQSYFPITYFSGTPRESFPASNENESKGWDVIDMQILEHIYTDARAPTTLIAKDCGISPDAIQYRLKKLREKGIVPIFRAWFDRTKIGYTYYKVFFWFQYLTPKDEEAFVRYCTQNPNIVFVNRVIGNWDFEFDIDAKDAQELHRILRELQNKFGPILKDYKTNVILKDYLPNPFRTEGV